MVCTPDCEYHKKTPSAGPMPSRPALNNMKSPSATSTSRNAVKNPPDGVPSPDRNMTRLVPPELRNKALLTDDPERSALKATSPESPTELDSIFANVPPSSAGAGSPSTAIVANRG